MWLWKARRAVAAWGGWSSWDVGFWCRLCPAGSGSPGLQRCAGMAPGSCSSCDAMPGAASFPWQGDRFLEAFRTHASAQISARDQSLASQRELGMLLVDAIDQQVPSGWAAPTASPAVSQGGLEECPCILGLGDALSSGWRWAWVHQMFLGAAAGKLSQIQPWAWCLPPSTAIECGSSTTAALTPLSCPAGIPGCPEAAFQGIHRRHL